MAIARRYTGAPAGAGSRIIHRAKARLLVRYGITVEEWNERREEFVAAWIHRPRDLV